MIRHFEKLDIRRIKPNEFSQCCDIDGVINDDGFYKFTLVDDKSEVQAIIFFTRYWKNNMLGFFLIAEDMPMICARELKRFMWTMISDLQIERLQTDSIDCEIINSWHEFLGFTCEGDRMKMIFDMDCKSWAVVKGRDF